MNDFAFTPKSDHLSYKERKKVLVTTSTFPRWKNDTIPPFVWELSKRLQTHDLDIVVLAPHYKGARKIEVLENIRIYRYAYLPSIWETLAYDGGILSKLRHNKWRYFQIPFFLFFQLIALHHVIKKEHIDTIHAHWIIPQGLIAVLYKKMFHSKVKIICTSHGSDILALKNFLLLPFKKFVLNNVDGITVVSHFLEIEVKKIGIKIPVDVLPMGIDSSHFTPDHYSEGLKKKYNVKGPLLIFVGRLSKEKGIQHLIEALPPVIKEIPEAKLLIIGTGTLEEELQTLCRKLQITDNVIFTGFIQHRMLPMYYATADILIGPSLHEGFGLVFIEALACGCAVISSDLPSLENIIIEGTTGFKVAPSDSKAITEKILLLLKNKDQLIKVKKEGRSHIQTNFDWKLISKKYSIILSRS